MSWTTNRSRNLKQDKYAIIFSFSYKCIRNQIVDGEFKVEFQGQMEGGISAAF